MLLFFFYKKDTNPVISNLSKDKGMHKSLVILTNTCVFILDQYCKLIINHYVHFILYYFHLLCMFVHTYMLWNIYIYFWIIILPHISLKMVQPWALEPLAQSKYILHILLSNILWIFFFVFLTLFIKRFCIFIRVMFHFLGIWVYTINQSFSISFFVIFKSCFVSSPFLSFPPSFFFFWENLPSILICKANFSLNYFKIIFGNVYIKYIHTLTY